MGGCSDHNEQAWKWLVEDEQMYYDKNEMVRIQVVDETWNEQEVVDRAKKVSPYNIQASMLKEGLGVCLWWD